MTSMEGRKHANFSFPTDLLSRDFIAKWPIMLSAPLLRRAFKSSFSQWCCSYSETMNGHLYGPWILKGQSLMVFRVLAAIESHN
jgi:hypothetical protein